MKACGTFWRRLQQPIGLPFSTSWAALFRRLASPDLVAQKRDLPGWAPVVFDGNARALANVERCCAIGLDLDGGTTFEEASEAWSGARGFIHTTFSHTRANPRLRVLLVLSRPVDAATYRRVWGWACERARRAGQAVDPSAKDPSRLWFVPGVRAGGEFRSTTLDGSPLDVDRLAPGEASSLAVPTALYRTHPVPASVAKRARLYLETCAPAVAGQRGHSRTFVVAQKLVRGFSLDEETALSLLIEWNKRCLPPWAPSDLARKVREAARAGTMQHGFLKTKETHHEQ